MQVLCKTSNKGADFHCTQCGQGFALYWERHSAAERADALKEIEKTLCEQHSRQSGPLAHPEHGFLVPEWNGPIAFSGAAILGNAPNWALGSAEAGE
jgi:hypothetical protein